MNKIIQVYNTINILCEPHNIQIEIGILIRGNGFFSEGS